MTTINKLAIGAAVLLLAACETMPAQQTAMAAPVPAPSPSPAPMPSPAPAPAPQTAPAPAARARIESVAAPTYVSIPMEITVNKPAKEVWARVGKFCDIGEWLLNDASRCTITSGKDGEFGTVRSVGPEILVGKTELSYTYTQAVRDGRPYNLYHGTLEARPVDAKSSKLVYTLVFDNSMLADQAARDADLARKRTQFENGLKNMKILAEGGKLPPAPARPAPAAGATPPARQ